MKLFTSKKGAVSVFLVIILVPTLVVTSIFVDASRMFLGKSVTESAADLALNSQLSQFDKELNEIYGLFATAKDANDVSSNLNKYFESCMISAGVETTDVKKYGTILSDLIDEEFGNEYSDLLQINVSEDPSISAVPEGNLGNPQELKKQIVSFMKYRAPVDLTKKFLKQMSSIKDKVDIVDDETEVTNTMNDYCESENKVLKNLYDAYQKIKNYQQNGGMNETYINNVKGELSKLKEEYKSKHKKMFKDLYNTQGIGYILSDGTVSSFKTKLNSSAIKNMKEDKAKAQFDQYVSTATYYINSFKQTYSKIQGLFNTYVGKYARKTSVNNYDLNSDVYPIQWYVALSEESNRSALNDYISKANNMNYCVARAYKAQQLSGKESIEYNKMIEDYRELAENPNRHDINNNFDETKTLYVYEIYIKPFRSLIKRVYDNDFKNNVSTASVNQYLKDTSNKLKGYYTKINDAKKLVNKANGYLKTARKELDKASTNYNKWENALNNDVFKTTESEVANKSKEAFDSKETKDFQENVTKSSIDELINRLNNIEKLLDNMLDLINSYKYNGKKVKDINSYSTFKNNSGINSRYILINKDALEHNANASFKFTSKSLDTIKINNSNHPDLEHYPKPALYGYMQIKFVGKENKETEKKLYETLKKQNKEDEDTSSSNSDELSKNEIGNGDGEKEKISKKISNIASNITGLFKGIGNVISNPTTARDDLYVLDYVMNMFSYHTYNKEGIYNLALEDGVKGLDDINTVKNLGGTYSEAWKNDKKTFTNNKTLTNYMINLDNNYSFGNEIEYILNGKSNDSNKSAVFGKIFMVRYAFDLAPEFSENWIKNELNTFAGSINAAFPFIPAALVKTVTILALTAAEAASDLKELKEGMKVKLVKKGEDLKYVFSVESIQKLANKTAEAKAGKGISASELKGINYLQYSDYLAIFLFIDLINTAKENKIMKGIGDVIGRNVGKAKGFSNSGDSVFKMSDANTYYKLKAKVQVEPLFLSIPMLQDERFNKSESVSWWNWDYTIVRGYN